MPHRHGSASRWLAEPLAPDYEPTVGTVIRANFGDPRTPAPPATRPKSPQAILRLAAEKQPPVRLPPRHPDDRTRRRPPPPRSARRRRRTGGGRSGESTDPRRPDPNEPRESPSDRKDPPRPGLPSAARASAAKNRDGASRLSPPPTGAGAIFFHTEGGAGQPRAGEACASPPRRERNQSIPSFPARSNLEGPPAKANASTSRTTSPRGPPRAARAIHPTACST